ncbi:MAG: cupredoxin domain-containing protein [Chloroflexi bacterium]|nr:cupredoxin domain-containing protein [Chloroflexota bacterium]
MTDQPNQPGRTPDSRLPARRPPSEPAPVDRFTAPRTAHVNELTPERAAKIVEQSASARVVGLLASLIVVLFTIIYYFYELGAPLGLTEARTDQQRELQQVTAIERGYNLFQANCARCHGPNGKGTEEGYTAPVLNDQMKLFVHLNAQYIENVLREGGRLVCGNAKSAMPIWSDENGGPLNYIQIENLIAFLRAPNNHEYVIRDPETLEPEHSADGTVKTFEGWRDPDFRPDPAATAVPDCWAGTAGPAPSASTDPNAPTVTIMASSGAATAGFDTLDVTAPADTAFTLVFDNQDATAPHNVVVSDPNGDVIDIGDNPFFTGPETRSYSYPALAAGTYPFLCQVHPTTMTGNLTVE